MNSLLRTSVALLFVFQISSFAETLPSPKSGGADGKAINLLVISSNANRVPLIDPTYEKELKAAGYNLHVQSHEDLLTMDFLKQFGVVVVANLPYAGEEFTVFGYKNRFVEPNLKLLHEYVGLGGGMLVMPAISEFGEAYGKTYDTFLKPWGARLLIQQLKDGSSRKNEKGPGAYGAGRIQAGHVISDTLEGKKVLYPMNVMRWDHSYSCTPLLTDGTWKTLATADDGQTHMALDNSNVGEPLTENGVIYAVRAAGKGMVALSAVHSYYTLTMVSSPEPQIGENHTGVINFQVMRGEKDGRPSSFGELIGRTFRAFSANSAKHGIGAWKNIPQPENPPFPESPAVVDWKTQGTPPTWAHRVIPSTGWPRRYDELPDPNVQGEMKYWKMLVGPRTAYSSGSGTVAEYKAAAKEAGYSAITFCETFEDLTPEKWASLLEDCKESTDEDFVCLSGLDIESYEGQRYLVLGAERFPSPEWLTPDGKRLQAVRMLSLGWFGHVSVVHRPNSGALNSKTYKHYTGIAVATYDTRGKLVEDGRFAYQWSAASDSSPIPIAVHEVMQPADVKDAVRGFQQIMPAPTLPKAIRYFRFAFSHVFDAPVRYFISEGPILWKTNRGRNSNSEFVDDQAEQALTEMGFRGDTPYQFTLTQGKLAKTAYFAHLEAQNGGVAGKSVNTTGKPMLMYVPMLITGLDTDSEMVLWRSDTKDLDAFAAFEGRGYVSFDADKTVDFYAGNAAICDPKLVVSMVVWDAEAAWFRVHNPTDEPITSDFATAPAVKGLKALKTTVTVAAGTSIEAL